MSECVWTVCTFGGKVNPQQLAKLKEFIEDIADSDDGTPEDAAQDKAHFVFQGQTNYGNPEEFMEFCRENDIPYHVSYAAACGVFGSGIYYWRPGMDKPEECDANDDGEPVASFWKIKKALAEEQTLLTLHEEIALATCEAVPPLELIGEPATADA